MRCYEFNAFLKNSEAPQPPWRCHLLSYQSLRTVPELSTLVIVRHLSQSFLAPPYACLQLRFLVLLQTVQKVDIKLDFIYFSIQPLLFELYLAHSVSFLYLVLANQLSKRLLSAKFSIDYLTTLANLFRFALNTFPILAKSIQHLFWRHQQA